MMGAVNAHYHGIEAFSETDQTEDLRAIDVPTLLMHGDDDQVVPIADSSEIAVTLLRHGSLNVYPGFPTACARPTPTSSTPTSWTSSSPERRPPAVWRIGH